MGKGKNRIQNLKSKIQNKNIILDAEKNLLNKNAILSAAKGLLFVFLVFFLLFPPSSFPRLILRSLNAWAAAYNFHATTAVTSGDIVVFDPTSAYGVKTTTAEGDTMVVGIAAETVSGGNDCTIRQDGGRVAVNVVGAVDIGQYLITSTTAGKAKGVSNLQSGVFGVAITASGNPAAGQCYASIFIGYGSGGGGGSGAAYLRELNDVGSVGYTPGHVLIADGDDYNSGQLSHDDLSDTGTNTHAQIDAHIDSISNPHSVTAAQTGAVATSGDETIAGLKTFSIVPRTSGGNPTNDNDLARKAYVDAIAAGLSWKSPVIDKDLSDPPGSPANGERYIVNPAGLSDWSGHDNDIAEWNGSSWDFSDPLSGWAVITTDDNKGWTFDGSTWIQFSSGQTYTEGDGISISGNQISVDPMTYGGLEIVGGQLAVNIDSVSDSLELGVYGLRVKANGVTNDMLAGSIEDSKLSTISTADKVAWAAVNKTGSALNDIADVDAPSPVDGQALVWDEVSGKWAPGSVGDTGESGMVMGEIDFISQPGNNLEWTNMSATLTELLGNGYARVKVDLTSAIQYRLVANMVQPGYSAADLNLYYSTDNSTFFNADSGAAGELAINSSGVLVGAWTNLVAGAKSEVYIAVFGKQGNGTVDPRFRRLSVQFRFKSAGAPTDAAYLVTTAHSDLPNAVALDSLGNGLMKNNGGTPEIAVAGTDYLAPGAFVDRGDPSTNDFAVGDLTTDGTWRDMNLGSIVPEGAKAVLIKVTAQAGTSGWYLSLRKNGNANSISGGALIMQGASLSNNGIFVIPCDSNRVVEYYATNGSWSMINICVMGWFL